MSRRSEALRYYRKSYRPESKIRRFLKKILKIIIIIFILRLTVEAFFLSSYRVETETAGDLLQKDDRILCTPLLYGPRIPFSNSKRFPEIMAPDRGDLVIYQPQKGKVLSWWQKVLKAPLTFITGEQIEKLPFTSSPVDADSALGRIIAVPGDSIRMREGVFEIMEAGQETGQEQWSSEKRVISESLTAYEPPEDWDHPLPFSKNSQAILLEEEEYFIVNDSRIHLTDSRLWGPVEREDIIGKVIVRYWPTFTSF
jgi:signal peptidase I